MSQRPLPQSGTRQSAHTCGHRSAWLAAALGLAAVMTGPSPSARADDEEWRNVLRQQLQGQYGCKLERFVFERQVPLGADVAREGRIQCFDGREVDYAQPNILLKFELRLCGPTVC